MERQNDRITPNAQSEYDAMSNELIAGVESDFIETPQGPIELEDEFRIAAPELESNPQLFWPESDVNGEISEELYNLRLNYRLTDAGFLLDGVREHINSEIDAEAWMELKRIILEAKTMNDAYRKLDIVKETEQLVYELALQLKITESDYEAARN